MASGPSQEGMNIPQANRQMFNQGGMQGQLPPAYSRVMAGQQQQHQQEMQLGQPQGAMRYLTNRLMLFVLFLKFADELFFNVDIPI